MAWALIGVLCGIIIGLLSDITIPVAYIKYTAVIIIGILDALFGAVKAEVTRDKYNTTIFVTGLIFNILLALGITFLGEKLGLDLYLAATVVFTFRIFLNLGKIRRAVIQKWVNL
ncbi:small basic family protein [Patescibacteria group bacterium]